MIDIQQLIKNDQDLFLALNGSHSLFWDGIMVTFSSTRIWIPLAIVLLYILLKNNTFKDFFLVLLAIALTITFCDQIASGLCKPFFERFRPTQDPYLMYIVDIVDGYRGGKYGFMSSHAANTFGVFVFISLLLKKRVLSLFLLSWASITSYSRIYLGVHYVGDVLCGALVGCMVGYMIYWLFSIIYKKVGTKKQWISNIYTVSGYLVSDINILIMTLLLTYVSIPIIGMYIVAP